MAAKVITGLSSRASWPTLLAILAIAGETVAQVPDPELIVEVDRDEIYEGESLRYSLIVNHVQSPMSPRLEGFDDFTVKPVGEQDLNSRQITIINGVRREVVRMGRRFIYELIPRRSGELTIPPPQIDVDGRTIRGRPVAVTVIPPDDQDAVRLDIEFSRDRVYPMQPFRVVLRVGIRSLPAPLTDRDPIGILRQLRSALPALSIPWVTNEQLPPGVSARRDWKEWIGQYRGLRRDGGFSINGLVSQGVFAFDSTEVAFLPPSERVDLVVEGKRVEFVEYTLEREFFATQVGPIDFGPASLKGRFVSGLAGEQVQLEPVFSLARVRKIEVRDVPEKGRPANYVQGIGQFRLDASLQPLRARVGDPLTLKLTFHGQGTLDSIVQPDLTANPEIATSFRVQEATTETSSEQRVFTYSLRPTRVDVTEFPAVRASIFDFEREEFVELATTPIPLAIEASEQLEGGQIVIGNSRTQVGVPEQNQNGLFGNITDPALILNDQVPIRDWGVALVGLGLLFGVASVQKLRQGSRGQSVRVRDLERILQGGMLELADCQTPRNRASLIGKTLGDLVSLGFRAQVGCRTGEDISRLLNSSDCPAETIARTTDLLRDCEATRFGESVGCDLSAARLEQIGRQLISHWTKSRLRK